MKELRISWVSKHMSLEQVGSIRSQTNGPRRTTSHTNLPFLTYLENGGFEVEKYQTF